MKIIVSLYVECPIENINNNNLNNYLRNSLQLQPSEQNHRKGSV